MFRQVASYYFEKWHLPDNWTLMTRRCKDVVFMLFDLATYIQLIINFVPTLCADWKLCPKERKPSEYY